MAIQVWDGTKYVGAELGRFDTNGTLKEALVWDGTQYVKVWSAAPVVPGLPVVTITGTSGTVSRDQFRAACTQHGVDYRTVQELPFLLDTSQATNLSYMFYGCSSLTTVPDLDTSRATNMANMFYGCSSLTTVPDLDTFQATNMIGMFRGCSSLTDGNVRCIGRHTSANTSNMILGSGLTRLPFYDTNGNPI